MKSRDKIREIGRSFKDLDGQAAFYVRRSRGRSTGFKEKCRGRRFFRDGRKKPRSELRGSHGTERRPILLAEQERGTFGCGQQALHRRAVSRRIHGSCESPARFKYFPDRMSGLRQDNEKGRGIAPAALIPVDKRLSSRRAPARSRNRCCVHRARVAPPWRGAPRGWHPPTRVPPPSAAPPGR